MRKQVTNVQRIQHPIMTRHDMVELSGGDETKYIVELTDKHVDGGATCVEEQVDSVKRRKTEVVFTINVQEEVGSVERMEHNTLGTNQPDIVRAEVDRFNFLQRHLEDDKVGTEELDIQKSTKMNLLLHKFGEEESQGSGRKKVFMKKVIMPAKRGQKLKGPRTIVTRIDDFHNFQVEGGSRKSVEDEN